MVILEKKKYTHKEREIKKEAVNAETKKQLTDLGISELTQRFVTAMNPTKQKIYVYLVRKGGAKRTQMTEELGMPLKTLETALQQMVKDGLISAPYSKRLDNYYALETDGRKISIVKYENETDTIKENEKTDCMKTPETMGNECTSTRRRKYTDKEREIMRQAINDRTMENLTELGVNELTQKFVTTMNPTKQKIYVYLVRKGGAKRAQMAEELGIPPKTLEKALLQMVKDDEMVSAPHSKKFDKYQALITEFNSEGKYVKKVIGEKKEETTQLFLNLFD